MFLVHKNGTSLGRLFLRKENYIEKKRFFMWYLSFFIFFKKLFFSKKKKKLGFEDNFFEVPFRRNLFRIRSKLREHLRDRV